MKKKLTSDQTTEIPPEYERRLELPMNSKVSRFERDRRLVHLIFPNQLKLPVIRRLLRIANQVRTLAEAKEGADALQSLLSHKRAILYFTQPSTRTRSSFRAAAEHLGMKVEPIDDPSVSSAMKGESEFDAIRMHCGNSDLMIIRSRIPRFAECCAYMMNENLENGRKGIPVINGGSGADQHPTQALLDLYTIEKEFRFEDPTDSSQWSKFESLKEKHPELHRGIDGKTFVFSGDIGRGRTVRSLVYLLSFYQDVTMRFVAPDRDRLGLSRDLKKYLLDKRIRVSEHHRLDEVVEEADALYMTRVQREHDEETGEPTEREPEESDLTPDLVERMKDYSIILHPLPRNNELPTSVDNDPRAKYFEQAENGQWIRAALIAHILDVENEITELYSDYSEEKHNYNEDVL